MQIKCHLVLNRMCVHSLIAFDATKYLKKEKEKNTVAPLITRVVSVCSRFHVFCNTNMACTYGHKLFLKA